MNKNNINNSGNDACASEHSVAQTVRDHDGNLHGTVSSMQEISIIETMESFLEENGAKEVDQKVLRRMAEALTKRLNDTSPGTLQDVTMDNSYAVAGYRSLSGSLQPNNFHGTASPSTQGRSVREFEEQLSALRKENFNLKLKLYFMEETLPGYQQAAMGGNEGPEALAKQIIDAKVEIEMLRKECKEKQELLRDAAQAITHLEDLQKQTDEKYQTVVDELKQKINFMEMERELERSQSSVDVTNGQADLAGNIDAMQRIGELESIIRNHEAQIEEYNCQITKLDEILVERDATIRECNNKIKELEFQNAELVESLERKNKDLNNAEMELSEVRKKYNKLKTDYKEILNDYKAIKEEYKRRMFAMKHTERELELQHEKIIEMESAVKAKRHLAENKIELLNEYEGILRKFNSKRGGGGGGAGGAGASAGASTSSATATGAVAGGSAGCNTVSNTSSSTSNCYTPTEPRENRFFRTIMNKLEGKRLPAGLSATSTSAPTSTTSMPQTYSTNASGTVSPPNNLLTLTGEPNCTKNKFQNLHALPNVSLFKTAAPTASYANPYNYALDVYNKCATDAIEDMSIYECIDQQQEDCCTSSSTRKKPHGGNVVINEPFAATAGTASEHCSNCHAQFPSSKSRSKQPLQFQVALVAYENLLARKFWHNPKLAQNFIKFHAERLRAGCNGRGCGDHSSSSSLMAATTATAAAAAAATATARAAVAEAVDAYKNHLTVHATLRSTATMHVANEIELKNQELRKQLQDLRIQMADKVCMLDETEEKLNHRTQVYEKACRTIQKLMLNIGNQQKEIAQLKKQNVNVADKEVSHNVSVNGLSGLDCTAYGRSLSDSETHVQNEALIADLRKQLLKAQNDADNADKWRRECADVCTVLTNRLEELAGFLNSLLKQKDVLGILAADKRRAMRKAVDRSLDLSKSLNMTLSFSGMSMADQSLVQISNLSEILGYGDDDEERTFNSHVDLTRPSIDVPKHDKLSVTMRSQTSSNARRSGDGKKERRSLPVNLPQENQSESEAWSEPDRKVSMARIGLDENSASLSKEMPSKLALAASSESECDLLNQSRNAKQRTQERITQLEQMIAQRDERILEIQSQLVDADSELKKENLRVLQLEEQIQTLKSEILEGESKDALLQDLDEKVEELEQCRTELDELKLKHEIALALAAEQLKEKLRQLRTEMEAQQKESLDKLQAQHDAEIEHDYVELQQYNEIKAQLLELQRQYIESQRTIDNLTDLEHETKQNLLDAEHEARKLKSQLDESMLQASKAVMERTKAFNDKLQLEQHVQQLKTQIAAQEAERCQLQQKLHQLEEQLLAATTNVLVECKKKNGDASASGYTSEEMPQAFSDNSAHSYQHNQSTKAASVNSRQQHVQQAQVKQQLRNNNTSSPDLGIESDAGRISSGEVSSAPAQRVINATKAHDTNISLQERNSNIKSELSDESVENIKPSPNKLDNVTSGAIQHDCAKVDQENAELRRKLLRTKKAFEDTYEKLRLANQRKAQIEQDIRNQILKTHNVLRNVRSNMENEKL